MQPEDFKEVWVELEQGGHNLTSVLNNPRETMVDLIYGVFGAFDADQAALEALNLAQPVLEPKQVDVSSVEPFLRKTGALSRAYVRNHRQRRGSSSTSQPVVPPNFEDGERAASMPSASSVTACFEAVPPLYFNANYSLEDPAIFEKVVENAGPEQQESLSHYLDLVEVCLLGQISERAGVFMDGLQTTHVLKDHVMEACRSVNLLRQVMRSLEDDVVLEALRVPRLSQRQKNLVALQEQLVLMQEVRRSKDSIEALICTEDFGGALDIIDSARGLLRGGLQDLQCMTRAAVSLNEFGALVGNLLADRFVTTAVSKEFSDTEKRLLLDTTSGLKRLGELPKALDLYRQRLEEDLKLIMRTVVGDYLASMGEDGVLVDTYDPLQDPEGEGGQSVNGLRALEHKAFLSCLEMCFEHLEAALKGGTAVLRMIDADLYASSDQKASLPSRLEVGDVTQPKTKECLQGLSRLIETAVSQLLTIRRDYHASLTAEQLKELWELSVAFIERVEGLTGTAGAKLRLTLLNQAKALVGHQHEANKKNLLGRLDAEKWSQVDVSEERQGHMDQLASGSILNGASLNNDNSARGQLPPSSQLQDKALVRERKREAVVDGAKYKAVWTSLVLVEMQVQMLRLAALFPAVATDVLTRSVDLLRLYNSRTTQLVLGAGAIHSAAKLRSISAKHLALCAQSLALVRALVPHMRAALAAQLSRKHQNLLAEMDGVSHDFLEHHDKVRFDSHMHSLSCPACLLM
jgi:vacuolar protein sorting-associated protein 54